MFQDIFARLVGLVIGIHLDHNLVEVLDDIFKLVWELSASVSPLISTTKNITFNDLLVAMSNRRHLSS